MVSENGSSVCMNPACISYREHQNTQNRDELASICIAIASRFQAANKNTALDPPGGAATASADVQDDQHSLVLYLLTIIIITIDYRYRIR
ncbi:hypothetical protein VTP01DRAFT_9879 [Rhizomucor pusillus]|uniref:uncharacterized protein n=1 Tax=Rhizomucor pusillus TaxID=4840 RepID=UPI003743D85B